MDQRGISGSISASARDIQRARLYQALHRHMSRSPLRLEGKGAGAPEGWFLGTKAENEALLRELLGEALTVHVDYRRRFHPNDPEHITPDLKKKDPYKVAVSSLRRHSQALFKQLTLSAPIFSMRHQGHMLWDQALPAIIGYFAAMLYNQNNVAAEASPVTTWLEIVVGNDLCRMLGFDVPSRTSASSSKTVPWGHITCDGTVANIEGLWAARNAKLIPVALRAALREAPELAPARNLRVRLLNGRTERLIELDTWVLLNLRIDDVVSLPQVMEKKYRVKTAATAAALRHYSVQNVGLIEFHQRFMREIPQAPVVLVPSTRHYSWPKAGAVLGMGQNNILGIHVDLQARMDIHHLEDMLQLCLQKRIPVMAVVAVIGSTEESAVDPLRRILEVREQLRREGLDFAVHCDAAWGGYFNSMLRTDDTRTGGRVSLNVPTFPMSPYVREQYRALREADSITVDPHKAGYVPYPAGALCYRNSAMRDLISLKAPVVFHSQTEPTVGVYGIEGSKPGAAAAAVYLAHRVIRPTRSGYGKILGQCMWTSKRMYSRLVTMKDSKFKIVLFQMLPAERANKPDAAVDAERQYISDNFVNGSNDRLEALLRRDKKARDLFMELGSDQVILAFSFNFYVKPGQLNASAEKMNKLNDKVFDLCSMIPPVSKQKMKDVELILTSSTFDPRDYGQSFVDHYSRRLGVVPEPGVPLSFLISTTMDPWTTDTFTPKGDFLLVVEKALRKAVHRAIKEIR